MHRTSRHISFKNSLEFNSILYPLYKLSFLSNFSIVFEISCFLKCSATYTNSTDMFRRDAHLKNRTFFSVCERSFIARASPSFCLDRPMDRHDVRRRAQLRETTAATNKLAAAQRLTPRVTACYGFSPLLPRIIARRSANCGQSIKFRVDSGHPKIACKKGVFQLVLVVA